VVARTDFVGYLDPLALVATYNVANLEKDHLRRVDLRDTMMEVVGIDIDGGRDDLGGEVVLVPEVVVLNYFQLESRRWESCRIESNCCRDFRLETARFGRMARAAISLDYVVEEVNSLEDNFGNVLARGFDVVEVGIMKIPVEQVDILPDKDCYFLIPVKVANVESYCSCFHTNSWLQVRDTYLHWETFLDRIH
jgi:hypothetical protein